jgi:hypothetical protein
MWMRRAAAAAALGLVLLSGCGEDIKEAVDSAENAAGQAKAGIASAKEKAQALNELAKVDPEYLKHPEQALDAARDVCAFMDEHSDKAKQAEEVRKAFDPFGASNLEAAQAKILLKILNNEVCPRLQ